MKTSSLLASIIFAAGAIAPAVAFAEGETLPPNNGTLPAPESDDDVAPEVASPGVPPGGIVKQAGIGGTTGYGRAGVLELGGGASFSVGKDLTILSIAPSIGWFLADNLQLTAIARLRYASVGGLSQTSGDLLIEPSYHLPFNRSVFGFLGLGVGGSYVDGEGAGFTIAPRLGANMMVGRSGILTPYASFQYTTLSASSTGNNTLVAVSQSVNLGLGYTVMW